MYFNIKMSCYRPCQNCFQLIKHNHYYTTGSDHKLQIYWHTPAESWVGCIIGFDKTQSQSLHVTQLF